MRITILFGGSNKERLVSVASAQALRRALPDAELWFWDVRDDVHSVRSEALLGHARPFEDEFVPGGTGVRVDTAAYAESIIPPYYDSLIAKLVVHGEDRSEAMQRMVRALEMFIIEGISTSIPMQEKILADAVF